jgi:glycosyltransferase involved in cell wall biosynthesis
MVKTTLNTNIVVGVTFFTKDKMKITFYDNHGKLSYNPHTEKNVGIGGAETVIIQTAKALVERGHEVSVYVNCNFPDYYDNVKYLRYQDYVPQEEDVLVGFENFPTNHTAKKVVNWSNRFYLDDVLRFPNVDKIIVVSEWHRDYFASQLPKNLVDKMVVINPGVVDKFFDNDIKKQPYNITYSGHPGKGAMPALIPIKERLKLKIPQAEIHVYGGGGIWGWDNEQYRPIYSKLINNGILYHGQIGKEDMVTRLNQAQIFLYPVANHHKETFCLQVLEAMASGCVVIASNSGNLRNLVVDRGFIIDGDINNYQWSMEVVEQIDRLFSNPSTMEYIGKTAREYAKQFTWQKTAENFEKAIL